MIIREMVEKDIELIRNDLVIVESILNDTMNKAEVYRRKRDALSRRLAELRLFRERGIFDEEQVQP